MVNTNAAPIDHDLTLVIPAFNEERRLAATLEAVEAEFRRSTIDYRVLVVDDGSSDNTASLATGVGRRFSALRLHRNQGKGAAVRAGMMAASGAVAAFTDADLPFDLSSLFQAYSWIQDGGCDAVFGARDLQQSTTAASRRFSRRLASAAFRRLMAMMVSQELVDTQCGLKVFSRAVAKEIFSRATIDGFAFDVEVVRLAICLGVTVKRIPVRLVNEQSSTLSLTRHAIPMLADAMRVCYRSYADLEQGAANVRASRTRAATRKAA
jgi:dolichyl-phosphate beta-glucosyltransferase